MKRKELKERKKRQYEVVAAVAKAVRKQDVLVDLAVPLERDAQYKASQIVEVSDDDYRSVHLPCDALDEDTQDEEAGNGIPGR